MKPELVSEERLKELRTLWWAELISYNVEDPQPDQAFLAGARAYEKDLDVQQVVEMPTECSSKCSSQEADSHCILFGRCPTKGAVLVLKEKP